MGFLSLYILVKNFFWGSKYFFDDCVIWGIVEGVGVCYLEVRILGVEGGGLKEVILVGFILRKYFLLFS